MIATVVRIYPSFHQLQTGMNATSIFEAGVMPQQCLPEAAFVFVRNSHRVKSIFVIGCLVAKVGLPCRGTFPVLEACLLPCSSYLFSRCIAQKSCVIILCREATIVVGGAERQLEI